MKTTLLQLFALSSITVLTQTHLHAANCSWQNPLGGNWSDPLNWSCLGQATML
jgi:hypothetical protein